MDKFFGLLQRNIWVGPLIALLLLLVGLVVGLGLGWMTADFKPGADDVLAVADSYALNSNADLAKARLKGLSKTEQEQILNQLIRDRSARGLTREAERLTTLGQQALGVNVSGGIGTLPPATVGPTRAPGTLPPTPTPTSNLLSLLTPILVILLVLVLVALAGIIFVTRILPSMKRQPRPVRTTAGGTPAFATPAPTAAPVQDLRVAPSPAPTTMAGGLGRFVPTYMLGNDNYDTSYSLETPKGEFLGECGMGISETVGEGKPDKVTAFDLWLFDKADVRTVTQILMSDFAYKDQTLRTKLATKGDAVLAEKGKTLRLETQSLRIEAHIVELIYATNPSFPLNSHFQKLVVEIVPTLKEGVAVPAR